MISLYTLQRLYTFPTGLNPKIETNTFRRGCLHPLVAGTPITHLHQLATRASSLQRTRAKLEPIWPVAVHGATSNIACLIFLILDGAHCVQRVDTMMHPVLHQINHWVHLTLVLSLDKAHPPGRNPPVQR